MRTFQEFMLIAEGMTLKDYKKKRSALKQKEKRAADKIAPNRRKDIHTDRYSPERAARHRANVDPDFDYGPAADERNYPGGKLKNPKKIRKAKALGELGEAYDAEVMSRSQIRKTGEGGRIGAERKKSAPERRRVKAVGGGKTEPVEYKPRKDIGQQRQASTRTQQPTQERGSARERQLAAAKEERRKAAQARAAAKKSGGSAPAAAKPKAKEAEKTATKLLSTKKPEAKPAPGYKAPKASGLSRKERTAVRKKGKALLRDLVLQATGKKKEKELKHSYTGPEKE